MYNWWHLSYLNIFIMSLCLGVDGFQTIIFLNNVFYKAIDHVNHLNKKGKTGCPWLLPTKRKAEVVNQPSVDYGHSQHIQDLNRATRNSEKDFQELP